MKMGRIFIRVEAYQLNCSTFGLQAFRHAIPRAPRAAAVVDQQYDTLPNQIIVAENHISPRDRHQRKVAGRTRTSNDTVFTSADTSKKRLPLSGLPRQ